MISITRIPGCSNSCCVAFVFCLQSEYGYVIAFFDGIMYGVVEGVRFLDLLSGCLLFFYLTYMSTSRFSRNRVLFVLFFFFIIINIF